MEKKSVSSVRVKCKFGHIGIGIWSPCLRFRSTAVLSLMDAPCNGICFWTTSKRSCYLRDVFQ